MAKILIPTALRQFTEQQDSVEVTGATVGEALQNLTAHYPNIKKNLFSDQGKLRSFVNVYVNGKDKEHCHWVRTCIYTGCKYPPPTYVYPAHRKLPCPPPYRPGSAA